MYLRIHLESRLQRPFFLHIISFRQTYTSSTSGIGFVNKCFKSSILYQPLILQPPLPHAPMTKPNNQPLCFSFFRQVVDRMNLNGFHVGILIHGSLVEPGRARLCVIVVVFFFCFLLLFNLKCVAFKKPSASILSWKCFFHLLTFIRILFVPVTAVHIQSWMGWIWPYSLFVGSSRVAFAVCYHSQYINVCFGNCLNRSFPYWWIHEQ